MFLCSISSLRHAKLKTEEKKQHMTPANVKAYNVALTESRLLNPDGPAGLIHMHSMTEGKQEGKSQITKGSPYLKDP